jgi:DNA-binding SARP family transcriptional activator/tetratricopeptide (TPR) repeat protein
MPGGAVSFRILGPLEAWAGGTRVALRGPRQERCLAALLLEPGRLVTFDSLVDATWDHPPSTARRQVQDLVTDLRRAMIRYGGRADLITTQRSGYLLTVDTPELDSLRFEELVATARRDAGVDLGRSAAMLRSALALCRGSLLAGIGSRALEPAAARWEELRLTAREDWLALELRLGNVAVAVTELYELVVAHPLRERPVELLMRALHAAGRTAEALEVYQGLRRRLADDAGLDPRAGLQQLQRAMLSGEAASSRTPVREEATVPAPWAPASGPPVPAQLPPDVRGFAGRGGELERLDAVALAGDGRPTAVVIAAVAGMAGVGKTALAVRWAHRVADRFPDGQLYLNLRGFDAGEAVMRPAEAVRVLLDGLQVPPARLPATFDAQVGLYRSLLVDKRMLVVLDNARDAEQVRHLLPGAPGCVVVVTSRNQLASLVVSEGAHLLTLGLLTDVEARQLLSHRIGEPALRSHPAAVDAIITSCERLPLALAMVAARAALHPGFPLDALAARLRRTRASLDAFAVGDPYADLRSVFSWSYDALGVDAARAFRLLGLHAGPDFGVSAVASLAGVAVSKAQSLLAELGAAHLVTEPRSGRFAFHDLLRAYAVELVQAVDTEADRGAATLRLLDHYLHTAYTAAIRLRPSRTPILLPEPRTGAVSEHLVDWREAQAWFAVEYQCLLAAVHQAAELGLCAHAWRLAWTLEDILDRRGHWRELAAAEQAALRSAEQQVDVEGQASANSGLARAYWLLGDLDRAHAYAEAASETYRKLGYQARYALMFRNLCAVRYRQGRYAEALAYVERGLALLPPGVPPGELAGTLNAAGQMHAQLGNHQQALMYSERALAVQQGATDDPVVEGSIVETIGYIHHQLGHAEQAVDCYQRSVRIFREADDTYSAARALVRLGETYETAGQLDEATQVWRQALPTLDEFDPPAAAALRDRLGQHDARGTAAPDR